MRFYVIILSFCVVLIDRKIVCSYIYEVGIDEFCRNAFVFVFKRKGV